MMKKIIKVLSIGTGMFLSNLQAQTNVNFGDFSKPVPSVSSLATYANGGDATASGIPDIAVPLLQLPTINNAIPLNLSLSYNPLNVSQDEVASQVGTGWSLFTGGIISRSIVNDIDELFDNTTAQDYYKNDFDDIYYYNIPGASGKFRVIRDFDTNAFELINLTSNRLKIEYTRTTNAATLIFNSFTITDAKGVKYLFNDYSRSNQERNVMLIDGKVYRSAFFLTRIVDANNVEIASFTYQKDIKYKKFAPSIVSYETCKLKTVTSPGFGKIEFDYLYDASMENTYNDPYQVQKVMLKDNYNHTISQYTFDYSYYTYQYSQDIGNNNADYKRILSKVKKIDKNNTVSEITSFEYSDDPQSGSGGEACPIMTGPYSPQGHRGVLKRVINPSGGVVEYNFEIGDYYKDRTDPAYVNTILANQTLIDTEVQYYGNFLNVGFDTNQTNIYTFTVPGNTLKRLYVTIGADELYPIPPTWETGTSPYVDYTIKYNDQSVVSWNSCGTGSLSKREYNLGPGTYTLQIGGSGGKGMVSFFGLTHIPQPFKNYVKSGIRIGNIKYYNSKIDTSPVKVTQFDYKSFTDNNASSGYIVLPDIDYNASHNIIYKNVKITNADDANGYTKYYYKIPDDYPKEPYVVDGFNTTFSPYYNFTSSGLLDKKEVYNAQNKLLVSEQIQYIFDNVPGVKDFSLPFGSYSKLAWLKKTTNTSKTYFENNQSIEESSETNFNVFNFEVASTKKVVDGNVMESFTTYPETGYPKLMESNIKSLPVMTEQKIDGELVSKTETKFDNTSSTLPTSMVMTNIAGMSKSSSIDLYDEKGNAVQLTSPTGVSTSIVYGYDKTQPIARIEGATYAQISSWIQTIINASNADAQDSANENALLLALDNFRKQPALQNARITTYTYNPLIGATTVTPPNGIREIYQYDNQNRLVKIVDMNGATLKEYQYNYKN